ncbi:hypothetical protein AYI70_g2036 [Smittium culicis]|uniref:Uncharacterized protein n=1 Tax=Smittium culicis TaxID=133412 RepID=A0A1R1YA05_9FUNG|nr:hypothetical protein AYI70_g4592 [Smittium culicis]OMJ23767.1 hypothetical protein AYI70_g2036 [Smittium culicis]
MRLSTVSRICVAIGASAYSANALALDKNNLELENSVLESGNNNRILSGEEPAQNPETPDDPKAKILPDSPGALVVVPTEGCKGCRRGKCRRGRRGCCRRGRRRGCKRRRRRGCRRACRRRRRRGCGKRRRCGCRRGCRGGRRRGCRGRCRGGRRRGCRRGRRGGFRKGCRRGRRGGLPEGDQQVGVIVPVVAGAKPGAPAVEGEKPEQNGAPPSDEKSDDKPEGN